MKQTIIYALDFDGVICDSALETGVSGWKSASKIWDNFSASLPTKEFSDKFRQVRPIMRTGYEAILIAKMIHKGESIDAIMNDYENKKQKIIDDSNLNITALKKLFGETRDSWIAENMDEWIRMNPLFPSIKEKLQRLSENDCWYVVTTKQERFVKKIFAENQISLSAERIYGLDRNKSKEEILVDLVAKHPKEKVYFVEDMLPSLLKVFNNNLLSDVKLFLVSWGYNTEEDRQKVSEYDIELTEIKYFLE